MISMKTTKTAIRAACAAAILAGLPLSAAADTLPITRANPEGAPDATGLGYSQVSIIETGRMAFISGQVAWTENFAPAPESLEDQAALVFKNATAILEGLGATTHDLVMVRVYMTELTPERLDVVFPLILAWFDGAKPSLTGVGVAALAAPDLQLEIEMTVRLPE
ncbi:RidA family protein [Labrenzia sp. ac12]